MQSWLPHLSEAPVVIERVTTPRGDLQLQRRGATYELIANGCFLMSTHTGGSESAMIGLAKEHVQVRRVCIGGLGVGYTLRAALDLPEVEHVTVVEIEPLIAEWNRTHLAPYHGRALDDPRVQLVLADLSAFLVGTPEPYDLIALDTDNGPEWTVYEQNGWLWSDEGLQRLMHWLTPGGVLACWSATASPAFESRLRRRFGHVTVHPIEAAVSDRADFIYLATAS